MFIKRSLLCLFFATIILSCITDKRVEFVEKNLVQIPLPSQLSPTATIPLRYKLFNRLTSTIPDEIPESVIPTQPVYHIRTRIVIDYYDVCCEDGTSMKIMQFDEDRINKAIEFTEWIYRDIAIKLDVMKCEFVYARDDYRERWVDALQHPGYLSIYWMVPNSFPYGGLSVFPWEIFPEGILLNVRADGETLAHEIGHYFGLMHTFIDDGCDDTPVQQFDDCRGVLGTIFNYAPNCRNIMNYCSHSQYYITKCQKERVLRYLRASRMNIVMFGDPEFDNKKFLTEKFEEFRNK